MLLLFIGLSMQEFRSGEEENDKSQGKVFKRWRGVWHKGAPVNAKWYVVANFWPCTGGRRKRRRRGCTPLQIFGQLPRGSANGGARLRSVRFNFFCSSTLSDPTFFGIKRAVRFDFFGVQARYQI